MIGARNHGDPVTCTDCGLVFINQPDETGALCEECCADRDAHTDALELRFRMAKVEPRVRATRRAVDTKVTGGR